MKTYDSIIIGGGPAGLSAAIYLARFNRSVLIIDSCEGRWQSREVNENYLGFQEGIPARTLVLRGRQQAEKFGAEFLQAEVMSLERVDSEFSLITKSNEAYSAKTVLFATGVKDHWPEFESYIDCIGRSLFWCITCDGHKVTDKKVTIVGKDDDAVVSCLQFLTYTSQLTFLTNTAKGTHTISEKKLQLLKKYSIPFYEGSIVSVTEENGYVQSVNFGNDQEVETEFIFSQLGAQPNSELAQELGVTVDEQSYILSDKEQRTNVACVYAAGDVTKQYAHQIVTAAHEGAQAAQAINYDLYSDDQKH